MWFKQIQLFQLADTKRYIAENFLDKLESLAFKPCLPFMPTSNGWVSPVDEENAPLIQVMNGYLMICLQIEEKILPAAVINQELKERVKQIELEEGRKVYQKRKMALKDEVIHTLLPRAFSKFTRIYAYIDPKNNWLVLGTTHEKKTEQFLSLFKKSVTEKVDNFQMKKLSPIITHWLKHQSYPSSFVIEKSCLLQDPKEQNRTIRCQQQNLFADAIQSFIKEGCEVMEIALGWHDRVNFVLADDFSLRSIRYQEEITAQVKEMEAETKLQQFNADFFIMSATLSQLLTELLELFLDKVEIKMTA